MHLMLNIGQVKDNTNTRPEPHSGRALVLRTPMPWKKYQ
ncbi:hypothetical protein Z949_2944 [Sulfitobacter guttiformis KCTC 32187]|nr:hypothetical protein Z949_2944 [Sulfitobacter guttiformis KCTC 32187]